MIDDTQQRHFSPMPPTRHPRRAEVRAEPVSRPDPANCRDKPTKPIKRTLPDWWAVRF